MAKFSTQGIDDLLSEMSALDVDVIAPKMLAAAAPIVEKNLRKRAASHVKTGDMLDSIRAKTPARGQNGWHVYVGPSGVDRNGTRNQEKLAYLEYGTSKQPATPVLTPAVRESEEAAIAAMQQVYDDYLVSTGL